LLPVGLEKRRAVVPVSAVWLFYCQTISVVFQP